MLVCAGVARAQTTRDSVVPPQPSLAQVKAMGLKLLGVLDDSTGAWVADATVRDTVGNEVRTTRNGLAALNNLAAVYGFYFLEIRKEGYAPRRIKLRADSASEFMVALTPRALGDATALPAVVTTAAARLDRDDGQRDGFIRRCELGAKCIGRRELDLHPTQKLADLLSNTRGIHRTCTSAARLRGSPVDDVPICLVEMFESLPTDVRHPYCAPNYFVDGILWNPRTGNGNSQAQLDRALDTSRIASMEVYLANEPTPARFVVPGSKCGAIVIWTR